MSIVFTRMAVANETVLESPVGHAPLSVSPHSRAAAFEAVPEPHRAASVVYPLPATLALAVATLLAYHHSVLAMAECGAQYEPLKVAALGFPQGRTPCKSTLQRLSCHLAADALSATLAG